MKEHNSVYLAWQSTSTREWHVVGLLKEHDSGYSFNYTKGARLSDKFIPFSGMENFEKTYVSDALFPLFKNRILSSRRPEYPSFLKWIGLEEKDATAINVLGRSGGLRSTDKLQMFKRFEIDKNGNFEQIFFAHGVSHLQKSASERVSQLKSGDKLKFCLDNQNDYDKYAVLIRADNPAEIVGFCPRYISRDINKLLTQYKSNIAVSVESLCDDAPSNYRLMCKVKGSIDPEEIINFMSHEEFQLITPSEKKI
ncbi:HIRAN domain-containing protein [Parendozoicomonas sp. Alg238-R29]|uniref:HIRAN domain-containing protein n=1 Tax=Parendozoicomonas sp. Alg238-R29 TaxID=2993446 RepID=UPI00248F2C11|nr:HIRAN domain-containing protein [Parendozoicomonas sp. Alg238-R29]